MHSARIAIALLLSLGACESTCASMSSRPTEYAAAAVHAAYVVTRNVVSIVADGRVTELDNKRWEWKRALGSERLTLPGRSWRSPPPRGGHDQAVERRRLRHRRRPRRKGLGADSRGRARPRRRAVEDDPDVVHLRQRATSGVRAGVQGRRPVPRGQAPAARHPVPDTRPRMMATTSTPATQPMTMIVVRRFRLACCWMTASRIANTPCFSRA